MSVLLELSRVAKKPRLSKPDVLLIFDDRKFKEHSVELRSWSNYVDRRMRKPEEEEDGPEESSTDGDDKPRFEFRFPPHISAMSELWPRLKRMTDRQSYEDITEKDLVDFTKLLCYFGCDQGLNECRRVMAMELDRIAFEFVAQWNPPYGEAPDIFDNFSRVLDLMCINVHCKLGLESEITDCLDRVFQEPGLVLFHDVLGELIAFAKRCKGDCMKHHVIQILLSIIPPAFRRPPYEFGVKQAEQLFDLDLLGLYLIPWVKYNKCNRVVPGA